MTLSAPEAWDRLLRLAKDRVSEQTFRTWLEPAVPQEFSGGRLVVRVADQFAVDWNDRKHASETETCAGWSTDRMDALYDKVSTAWEPYGHLAGRLPPELRERHQRIYDEAIRRARQRGWNPELDDET